MHSSFIFRRGWLVLVLALAPLAARADDAVVGDGTAASCTEAAFDGALAQLYPGATFPGGTITFDCGPNSVTIVFTSQKGIGLGTGTVIDGNHMITFDGGNTTRLFAVTGNESRVELRNLDIVNGHAGAGEGGAIHVGAGTSLLLDQVWVIGNRAGVAGGGIFTEAGSALAINVSRVSDNLAAQGGGIAANGSVSLTNTSIVDNIAQGGEGGGLWVHAAQTTMLGTLVYSNDAVDGAGLLLRGGIASIEDSDIRNNIASGRGGGIAVHDDAQVRLDASTWIFENVADQGGGLYLGGIDEGPGNAPVVPANAIRVFDSRIEANQAREGGGAYVFGVAPFHNGRSGNLYLKDSQVTANTADYGGGVHSQGRFVAYDSRIDANRADVHGAGVYLAPTVVGSIGSDDSVTGHNEFVRLRVADNAAADYGGGIYATMSRFEGEDLLVEHNLAQRGGGLALVTSTHVPVQNLSLVHNVATEAGGGLYVESAYAGVTLQHATLSGNNAELAGCTGAQIFAVTDDVAFPTSTTRVYLFDVTLVSVPDPDSTSLCASVASSIGYARSVIVHTGHVDACGADFGGVIDTLGSNVLLGYTCPFGSDDGTWSSEAAMMLGPLATNGAFAPTHLPAAASPITDNHPCPPPPAGFTERFDQRGRSRDVDGNGDGLGWCDAGAVERQLIESDETPFGTLFRNGFE